MVMVDVVAIRHMYETHENGILEISFVLCEKT